MILSKIWQFFILQRNNYLYLGLQDRIQSLAYGTRRIISYISEHTERHSGMPATIDTIFLTGGLAKNSLFVSQHAEITNCRIVLPKTDAVLLGSAVVAGSIYKF